MPPFLSIVCLKMKQVFGQDAFDWWDRSYIFDWSVACICWLIASFVKGFPPFERDFDRNDPLIDQKHRKSQISGNLNWMIAIILPLGIMGVAAVLRRSALNLHHSCLSLWACRGLAELVTEVLKNRVGRLRPDFLSRCDWDKTLKACGGKVEDILDGRRSFPSGHSSTAFSGMMFLSLWIAGMTGAWRITQPAPARSLLASKLARLTLSIIPLFFATWVAVSRIEDNKHHKEDVIIGSLIGIVSAIVCYLIYWPSPFVTYSTSAKGVISTHARAVYRTDVNATQGNGYQYELAGMEHTNEIEAV